MLLKYFYEPKLAHASYFVGCQRTGEALVVDPARDIQPYLDLAKQEKMKIVGVAETHIHADYVSGARELADVTGATLYLSGEGGPEWQYDYADLYPSVLLKDGEEFAVGNVRFETMHTPGHTPESISFLLTDEGGGASAPMGLFTGDFVFVGSIGRPDLLEQAVGAVGTAEAGARAMFNSLQRFKALPDYLQVWPAHGAGSACGKGLGAIPSSTVGYEKLFNPGLRYDDEDAFVEYLLADQPEVPPYFAVMKRVNKEGPPLLHDQPEPAELPVTELLERLDAGEQVVDLRSNAAFANSHVPGTINLSMDQVAAWAGWVVDYDKPLTLITSASDLPSALRQLYQVGAPPVQGWFDADKVLEAGLNSASYREESPRALSEAIQSGEVRLIDVRAQSEWDEGHLPNAEHIMLGYLPARTSELVDDRPVVVQCRSGARSAIAASLLQAAGAKEVINLTGGYNRWVDEGLPVEEAAPQP